MNKELAVALEIAEKQEADGIAWYSKIVEKCDSEAGKQMFRSFVEDEERHLRWVKSMAEGLGIDLSDAPLPRESIKTVFTAAKGEEEEVAKATDSQKDAISVALDMEKESYANYKQAAGKAEDPKVKEVFERLALEENQHYEMLTNTLEYLNNNDQWFLWTEQDLLTGDMSSLGH